MKNLYCRKRRINSLKEFLAGVPKITSFMYDPYPRQVGVDDCCEIQVDWKEYNEKRSKYFKLYPFWYLIAKLLNRKEVR